MKKGFFSRMTAVLLAAAMVMSMPSFAMDPAHAEAVNRHADLRIEAENAAGKPAEPAAKPRAGEKQVKAVTYRGTYDGQNHDAVTVSGMAADDKVEYRLGGDEAAWTTAVPQIKDAGDYEVAVRITGADNQVTNVKPTPSTAHIEKAEQQLKFNHYTGAGSSIQLAGALPGNQSFDFSATAVANGSGGQIGYTVELIDGTEGDAETTLAEIDASSGQLKVFYPGTILVKASLPGNLNYKEATISYKLQAVGSVSAQGQYIRFAQPRIDYKLGANDGTASTQQAEKRYPSVHGRISYSMPKTPGLSINKNSGAVTVTDYTAAAEAIRQAGGTLQLVIKAEKSKTFFYGADSASYRLAIAFADAPASPYTVQGVPAANGWYNRAVKVAPAEGYQIARMNPENFSAEASFDDQGIDVRYVYLRNMTAGEHFGEITDRLKLNLKIDTVKPDTAKMRITYSEPAAGRTIESAIFSYYNPSVTVTFEAEDETSGLHHLNWSYTKAAGASKANVAQEMGMLTFDEHGKAQMVLTGSQAKQYRGHISFTATDNAGNTSERKRDDEHVVVVDTIAPNCSISYTNALNTSPSGQKQRRYYDGDVIFTVQVKENNFYQEDFIVRVSKDGAEAKAVTPSWENAKDESGQPIDNAFVGKFTLSGDGDYVVFAEYKDRSNNQGRLKDAHYPTPAAKYESDIITIDTIKPQASFSVDKGAQSTTFTVVDKNFRPERLTAVVKAKDRSGKPVEVNDLQAELRQAEWVHDGDTHSYSAKNYVSGIYDVVFGYKDPSNHEASFTGETFVIDHNNPTAPIIDYSAPISGMRIGAISLAFYNPLVDVTLSAYDRFSGVDHFTWSYTRQDEVSAANAASYESQQIEATESDEDPCKFVATFKLPLNEADQLRGYVAATAMDNYGNLSEKVTDSGKILVVDTVSPTMTVEYSEMSHKAGDTLYYGLDRNGQVEVTLNVEEANFFADDVLVHVTKDGGKPMRILPEWTDISADRHIGRFSINGDGRYVVSVQYADRSANRMNPYTSETIIIDTVRPAVDVTYKNHAAVNTLTDREGHRREYFDRSQMAVITVTERNFDPNKIKLDIAATDAAGSPLNQDGLISKSSWRHNGDTHQMDVEFRGDANYAFEVSAEDMAGNIAVDQASKYFTVDSTKPTVTNVSYSTSVLDTILSNISFGFYNAKMKVTITAADETAGLHGFNYSYINADGVSGVNQSLFNQAIGEAEIVYSDGGKTGSISFEIPKLALDASNQFNGTVKFDVADRSGNRVEQQESRRVVVDNIAPRATVTFDSPANVKDGVAYYSKAINGSIAIDEANFYSEDAVVTVSKDGGAEQQLPTNWRSSGDDRHIGAFTLDGDGRYVVSVAYRDKSGNAMAKYTSGQLVLDTKIDAPTYTINGKSQTGDEGGAYRKKVEVAYHFADQNYEGHTVKLTRQRFDQVEDITEAFIRTTTDGKGGSGSFNIPEKVENDGIYLLTITMTDQAKNTVESHVRFTVNRFGSVYVYDDYLCSLIKDGGTYIKKNGGMTVLKDLQIREFNADRLVEGSLKVLITRDGEPINAHFTKTPVKASGWFEYLYTIGKDNFEADGVYKITVSSSDATGNVSTSVPENSMDRQGLRILDTMKFTVDTVAPEIRNIVNLEHAIADRQAIIDGKLNVKYTLVDVGGLARVEIYVNGQLVDTVERFENAQSYSGSFDISESNDIQTVRLIITDLAGNVTDTASESFDPGTLYTFNDKVTVSTNFFVRWYRNTPVFWGSIAGIGIASIGLVALLLKRRRKPSEDVE